MFGYHISLLVHKQLPSDPSDLLRLSSPFIFESRDAVLFQKICNSAPYHIIVKTWIAGSHQWLGSI